MAKRRSKKGGRRAYLKKWSGEMVKVGTGPTKHVVREYAERIDSLAENEAVPITRSLLNEKQAMELAEREVPRALVIKRFIVGEGKEISPATCIANTTVFKINLYQQGPHYFFEEINKKTKEERISITYRNRETALDAFFTSRIVWVERRQISEEQLARRLKPNVRTVTREIPITGLVQRKPTLPG